MSGRDKEPFNPDFRYEVVTKTLREIANSELVTGGVKRPETKFGRAVTKSYQILMGGVMVYSDPKTTQEQRDIVEPDLFNAIIYLKTVNFLKPAMNKDQIINALARIEVKQDALSALLKDILVVLTGLTEKVEEALRK